MKVPQFLALLTQDEPPATLNAPLRALWWDRRGDWARAHSEVDALETTPAMCVHGYLHRKAGDKSNAAYWYQRAGRAIPDGQLDEEWTNLLEELLGGPSSATASS